MASSYYNSAGKTVVDGDVAYAADLNDVNIAVDTGFQQVETDVDTIAANQPFYSNLAQKWAEELEDVPVEVGKFSSKHWAAKAEDQAILADADRVQTAADRVQTGLDRVQTGLDETQTNADRVQTGLDKVATAADRVQTGLDRTQVETLAAIMPVPVSGDKGNSLTVMSDLSLEYQPANRGRKNYIVDGNFDVWLEATSQTASGYGSDTMWRNDHQGSTKTHLQQSFTLGQTLVPGNPKYFSRTVVTSVAGASNYVNKQQRIESVRYLAGQKAILSFWAKADSPKNIAIEFEQYFGSGGSPSATISGIGAQIILLSTAWTKYSITIDIPSISGKVLGSNINDFLGLVIFFDAGTAFDVSSANLGQQSGTFDIAQIQLEEGDVATTFERRSLGDVLAEVQRYFRKDVGYTVICSSSTGAYGGMAYTFVISPAMRAAGTVTQDNLSTTLTVGLNTVMMSSILLRVTPGGQALDGQYAVFDTRIDARL